MSSYAVETQDLTKIYGRQRAVDTLRLQVPAGTLFGLIGPNGAGKTTTLRMLAGLINPSRGRIFLGGQQVRGLRHESMVYWSVGYMPDFFGVYEDMKSWEYLDFFARCYEIPKARRKNLVDELLDLVDLSGKRNADVNSLSRGMKQRLCLAHALVHDPQILLLDEPASGLDPRARLEMRELLLELRDMGKTIIISSHILSEMEDMCDAVGIMEQGKLLAGGDVGEIERSLGPGHPVALRVLSEPEKARSILAGLKGVTLESAEPGPSDEADEDGLSELENGSRWVDFYLDGDEAEHAAIIRALVEAGIQVSAYRPRERDLENMFMRITKGEVS